MKYQIDSHNGQYYWRLVASNGRIIAVSGEFYTHKADCLHGINLVKASFLSQYAFYQDSKGEWRWRLRATNGQIIAVSSEGYRNRQDCEHAAALTASTNSATPVEDLTATAAAYR